MDENQFRLPRLDLDVRKFDEMHQLVLHAAAKAEGDTVSEEQAAQRPPP